MSNRIPINFDNALIEIAIEYGMRLDKETHFEALNREVVWFDHNILYRLDFNYDYELTLIKCTAYVDTFPQMFPRLLRWLHLYVPGFPYKAKSSWFTIGTISLEFTKIQYKDILRSFISRVVLRQLT